MERIKKVEDKYKRYPPSLAPETPQFLSTKPFSNQVELNIQICPTFRFPRRPHCAVNSNSYLDTLISTIKNEEKTPVPATSLFLCTKLCGITINIYPSLA